MHCKITKVSLKRRVYALRCALTAAALALSACQLVMPQLSLTLDQTESTNQFVSVPLNTIWVSTPDAVTAMQRGLVNSWEQRIGLTNRTAAPGDNMLVLLARSLPGQDAGRFVYEEFLQRIGGLPEPFTDMKSGDLQPGEDALGPYFWAQKRYGDNAFCVLALRRLTSDVRQLPYNTSVMDVMLRNCAPGTVDDALKPITAASIGNFSGTSSTAPGSVRMLSPLAGPTPRTE